MSNRRGTKSISVYWMGNKNYSCPKIGATKIFCVLDKGYNSLLILIRWLYTNLSKFDSYMTHRGENVIEIKEVSYL